MARIKRSSGQGVRRAAKSQSRAAGARRAKATTTSMVDRAMGVLPFSEEQWSTIWLTVIIGGAVGIAFVIATKEIDFGFKFLCFGTIYHFK